MFGSHLSIAGGLHNALIDAEKLEMDCVQIFTKNQRQWKVKALDEEGLRLWQAHRRGSRLKSVVSHDSYLINLASPDRANREKSIALFRHELLRCEQLEIPFLVTHPGAHMKAGEAAGLKRVARSLDRLHKDLPGLRTVICLEITAGQGTTLGYCIEHLGRIIDSVKDPQRLAICLDTAHLLASGHDLRCAKATRDVLARIDDQVGIDLVKVLHLNDSKSEFGSRVDRHEHIGHGKVSMEAFRVIVNYPPFRKVPKILETAKLDHPDGRPWDAVNLERLRGLVRGSGRRRPAGRQRT